MNKIIYLVRGLPGSGKTTLAKLLAARHFETDNFFVKEGKYEFDPSKLPDAHRWCQANVENVMGWGKNVVVSNTFTQDWEMQPYFDLAKKYGYMVITLIVENRNNTKSVHSVPEASIEKMKNRFEICLVKAKILSYIYNMKIVLSKGQKLWFTSDTHYNHGGICSATTSWKQGFREFPSLELMNDTLVNNINNKVGENDILIHLGDWSFGGFDSILEFRNRIKCKNIHLVLGNHCHHIKNNKNNIQSIFTSVQDYLYLDLRIQHKEFTEKYRFVCMHFPISSWDGLGRGVMHLHGHTHLPQEFRVGRGKSLDVGVDGNNFEPISLQEVLDLLKNQPNKFLTLPQDHHEI